MKNIEVILSLLNLDLVNIEYEPDLNVYYIYFKGDKKYSISLNHTGSGDQDIFSLSFHSKKGIKKLYEVFPSADKINFERDRILINKFRFLNAYLTGTDFNLKTDKLDDYISSDTYRHEHFIRHSYINTDDTLEFCIIYDYDISINDKSINLLPYFSYRNNKFYDPTYNFFDIEDDKVQLLLYKILSNQAKTIDKKAEELKLIDYNIFQIINFD